MSSAMFVFRDKFNLINAFLARNSTKACAGKQIGPAHDGRKQSPFETRAQTHVREFSLNFERNFEFHWRECWGKKNKCFFLRNVRSTG